MEHQPYCQKESDIATMKEQIVTLRTGQERLTELSDRVFERVDKLLYTVWGAMITIGIALVVQVVRWAFEHKIL